MVTRAQAVDTRLLFSPPTRPGNGTNAVMYLDVGWTCGGVAHFWKTIASFPPSAFDRLQYANTEGEGLGEMVTCGYIR